MKTWTLWRYAAFVWAYVSGKLEDRREAPQIWRDGVFCDKPSCHSIGQYRVEQWKACRKHADELMDLMIPLFADAINDLNRREMKGEFLPKPDTSRGFEVYKSRRVMGPSINEKKYLIEHE